MERKIPKQLKSNKIPSELGPAGRDLWRQISEEYGIEDAGGLALLLAACRAEDDIQRMRLQVATDGDLCPSDRSKPHALLAAIRGSEAVRRQSIAALHLDVEPQKNVGRPSGR